MCASAREGRASTALVITLKDDIEKGGKEKDSVVPFLQMGFARIWNVVNVVAIALLPASMSKGAIHECQSNFVTEWLRYHPG